MLQGCLRSNTDAWFRNELESILRERAQNITLTCGKWFCRTDGCVEEPKTTVWNRNDAGGLELGAIEIPRPLQSNARFFSPLMCHAHGGYSRIVPCPVSLSMILAGYINK